MDVWILRFPEPRQRLGESRQLVVLQRTEDGVEKELDALEVEARGRTLDVAVEEQIEKGRSRLILDLIHQKHMDSNDLAHIIGAFKQARESGGELVIANPNAKIQEIFRITHLEEEMALFDSVKAAAEYFKSSE